MTSLARSTSHPEHAWKILVTDILFLVGEAEAGRDVLLYLRVTQPGKGGAGILLPFYREQGLLFCECSSAFSCLSSVCT